MTGYAQQRREILDPDCTAWTCPECGRNQYHDYGPECDECGFDLAAVLDLPALWAERDRNALGAVNDA